jgi:RNA polymerase II subunit A-like phosphatase
MIAQMFGNGAQILSKSSHTTFFVGIGDINSTFLPKLDASTSTVPQMPPATAGREPQTDPGPTPSASTPGPLPDDSQSNTTSTSSADEAVAAEILQKEMIARNSLALEAQVEERPLAKLQEELQEAANGQLASESPASSISGQGENTSKPSETPGEKHHHRKALLKNDDVELQRIKRLLDIVHEQFFEAYDTQPSDNGGNAKILNKAQPSSSILYDVRIIIPGLRLQTFDGLHILFSSVIPLDTRPETTDIWNLAEAFGASCHTEFSSEVTHLVAAKRGTAKIDQARKRGNIKIVWLAWFTDSIARWERQDETSYLMDEPRSLSATAPDTMTGTSNPGPGKVTLGQLLRGWRRRGVAQLTRTSWTT